MGLFSSNKKEKMTQPELPPLKFPDLPSEDMPMYGQPQISEAQAIKQAITPVPERNYAPMHDEKPLFVRVEKYKDVMETLNGLKMKLSEAGDILRELSRIKAEEEQELNSWQQDLENVKEKLLAIERNLTE